MAVSFGLYNEVQSCIELNSTLELVEKNVRYRLSFIQNAVLFAVIFAPTLHYQALFETLISTTD